MILTPSSLFPLLGSRFKIYLCIPACAMSSEFTLEVILNFYRFKSLEFDVNEFEAIFGYLKIAEYREITVKKKTMLITHAGMQI